MEDQTVDQFGNTATSGFDTRIETGRNLAIGDPNKRRGEEAFTVSGYYDVAEVLKGRSQCYAMYFSYGEAFGEHVRVQGHSVSGWSGAGELAYFEDIPVDFDSDNLEQSFKDCARFVEVELIGRGIPPSLFVIYLSGGKGFHVHISASCFPGGSPMEDAPARFSRLAKEWKNSYPTLDTRVYDATRVFRLPGSRHKSGLFKTEIPWDQFTWEYIEKRHEWASQPPALIRRPIQLPPLQLIEVPELPAPREGHGGSVQIQAPDQRELAADEWITKHCMLIRAFLEQPEGREDRRTYYGILQSKVEPGESNPELDWYRSQLFEHPHIDVPRQEEILRWDREYERDGVAKVKKSCVGIGCEPAQRARCKVLSPLDWTMQVPELSPIPVADARALNSDKIQSFFAAAGNGIYTLCGTVGLGKTLGVIEAIVQTDSTAFLVAPTHALADQTQERLLERGISVRHIAARGHLERNHGFQCLFPKEVSLAQQNGYGPQPCQTCPRRRRNMVHGLDGWHPEPGCEPCDYYEQFEGIGAVEVVIGVHEHLNQRNYDQVDVHRRDITIIDESPVQKLAKEIRPLDPKTLALLRYAIEKKIETHWPRPHLEEAATAGRGMFARVRMVLLSQQPSYELEVLSLCADVLLGRELDRVKVADADMDEIRAVWRRFAREVAIEEGLAAAAGLADEWAHLAIPFHIQDAIQMTEFGRRYDPTRINYLPSLLPPNKVLILDATADERVYSEFVAAYAEEGRPHKFIELPLVEQPYSRTVQLTNASYGVGALREPATRHRLTEIIRRLRKRHPGPALLVCHLEHEEYWREAFADDIELEIAHFYAVKGLNNWAGFPSQYIVGTPFVPDSAILELGRKFGMEVNPTKLKAATGRRPAKIAAKSGRWAITRRLTFHGFDFHSAAWHMASQGEVVQAVRIRLYDPPKFGKQHVFIFSNVALKGMYADELMSLDELESELGIDGGGVANKAFKAIEAWFLEKPAGHEFRSADVVMGVEGRYIRSWLRMAGQNGWVEKRGERKGASYIKLRDP